MKSDRLLILSAVLFTELMILSTISAGFRHASKKSHLTEMEFGPTRTEITY